ncbi:MULTISPECIES: helix-turn-helix domain-containing protein [Flavobacterium]|jgi:predicted DNA-binding mobile mystery protein A|uniref:XRE family transcriptional regulator n=1 Tax=Flavobacterium psychrolimnae TaxID=249351 RepID=A0A366AZK0_9FLAO|nr:MULTISPECIES: helix-turn-helix domain-containing protein [Flavobacterium]MDI6048453.1 helix-turn-helix domain-containing protein [Flavobacterium sp. XS2P24]RBN49823.1 XRE family transcriptional regulator [Flavobacterium psychrolimnae]
MRTNKQIILEQLDQKSSLLVEAMKNPVSENGWVFSIRKGLNMTLEQLGNKLGISKQGVRSIEESETNGSISIKSLKEVAKVLDMQLVYGFVPNKGSFSSYVEDKSKELAKRIVMRTHQTMQLENQGNREIIIQKAIEDLAFEIKQEMRRSLWD